MNKLITYSHNSSYLQYLFVWSLIMQYLFLYDHAVFETQQDKEAVLLLILTSETFNNLLERNTNFILTSYK